MTDVETLQAEARAKRLDQLNHEPHVAAAGLLWLNRGPSTDDHLAHGGHEQELGPLLRGLYKPGTTYVNVGAHVGTWTVRMARIAAATLAVEANPNTFLALVHHAHINATKIFGKIICEQSIVWDRAEKDGVFFVDAKGVDESGSTRLEVMPPNMGQGYSTTTLDALVQKQDAIPPVGLIQMDVEGAEARVLRGGAETIARDKPVLLIELHEGHPGTDPDLRQQVLDFLGENSYSWSSAAIGVEEYLICLPSDLPEFTDIA